MMKTKKAINPSFYLAFPEIMATIAKFDQIRSTIKDDRNVVKVSNIKGIPVVIKYFKRITLINRIIYGLFRKSKAQRAYENAGFLEYHRITTPMPVAYVDFYRFNMLQESYFISLYVNCKSSEELFYKPIDESQRALKEFARFTYQLHKSGIFHADYSPGNVLYSETPEGYEFCLIDNNRMRIRQYSRKRAIRNLRRINLPLDKYAVFAMEYSRLEQSDAHDTAQKMLFYMQTRKVWMSFKRKIKSQLRKLTSFTSYSKATAIP